MPNRRRLVRLAATCALLAGGAAPAPAACVPTVVVQGGACADGGVTRTVEVSFRRGNLSAAVVGMRTRSPTDEESFACVAYEGRTFAMFVCGLPLAVSIDPAMQTGTVSGTASLFGMGTVRVNVTASARQGPPETGRPPHQAAFSGCFGAGGDAESPDVERPATGSGSISFGRYGTFGSVSGALLGASAAVQTFADGPAASPACAFSDPSEEFGAEYDCGGIGVYPWFECASVTSNRTAFVGFSRGATHLDFLGVQSDQITGVPIPPSPPANSQSTACVAIRRTWIMLISCDGGLDVAVDPALRSAHVKGTIRSGLPDFGGGPAGLPDFGSVKVDLTFTGSTASVAPNGVPLASEEVCGAQASLLQDGPGMHENATADGTVVFKKLFGSFAAHAKPGVLSAKISTLATAGDFTSDCFD